MENLICKAEIKARISKVFKILTILLFILGIIVFISVHFERPDEYDGFLYETYGFYDYCYNIFSNHIYDKPVGEFPAVSSDFSVMNLIPLSLVIIILIQQFIIKFILKRCSLELSKDGIIEKRKYLFSNKLLQLPIEKVDSILIENRIIDKIFGGETIAIRSASGLIRFICVQNASEFVDKTLESIKAYKESNPHIDVNIPTNTSSDNLEQIKKLKEMLDNGIITQDEFDTKKKQLLGL